MPRILSLLKRFSAEFALRIAPAALASLTGISALLAATDPETLGVSAASWAWAAMVLAIGNIVVTAVRTAFEQ